MGGGSSKSKSDVFVESVNNAFITSIQSCSMNSNIEQIISIKGDGNVLSNVELNQVYSGLLTCVQDLNVIEKLQNDVTSAIKSSAEKQDVALLGVLNSGGSDVDTKIHHSVVSSINKTTMTQLVSDIKAMQTINIQGSGNTLLNINMKQVSSNIASSSQKVVSNIDVVNTIKNSLEQSSKSTQQDPIANLLKGLSDLVSGPIMWIAIIIIGGIIGLIIFLNTGAGASVLGMAQDQMNGPEDDEEEYEMKSMDTDMPAFQQPPLQQPTVQQPTVQSAFTPQSTEPVQSINSLMSTPENLPKLDESPRPSPVINENPRPSPVINENPRPSPVINESPRPAPVINETINQTYQPLQLEESLITSEA